ncbi:Uncharacterised protein [Brucella anthropi]|nr:hypothetical protein DR92_4227 [Brucella anthropi]SUB45151.1 Uncharacterised protein [Brucella anthropi]
MTKEAKTPKASLQEEDRTELECGCTCSQMPENTVRNVLFIDMRFAAHCGRKKWFNHRPFEISSIKARFHCLQSLETVKRNILYSM